MFLVYGLVCEQNLHFSITVKTLIPVGCQTSKVVVSFSLCSDTVLRMHIGVYTHVSSTCIHMCGSEGIAYVKLDFYLSSLKWFDGSQAGSFLGPEDCSFSYHQSLSVSLGLTEDVW